MINKQQAVKNVAGHKHAAGRSDLENKFIPGSHGLKIVPNSAGQYEGKGSQQQNELQDGPGIITNKSNSSKKYYKRKRKANAAQTGDISGVDLPRVYPVVPRHVMGNSMNQ
jgi:hypothetical protein